LNTSLQFARAPRLDKAIGQEIETGSQHLETSRDALRDSRPEDFELSPDGSSFPQRARAVRAVQLPARRARFKDV
jgi:hypothetical protein